MPCTRAVQQLLAKLPLEAADPVADWSHVENGKIATVRVVSDARPLVGQ